MTKRYLEEIENVDNIMSFDDLGDYLAEDDQGQYFKDAEEFDWWKDLADAMQYLEDEEVEYDRADFIELEDYITLAKENGFRA